VTTLQNVAVISWMQKTPVVGADVASCAVAGDAAKSNAEINASFFIGISLSLGASQ